jgi:hypothetical protein
MRLALEEVMPSAPVQLGASRSEYREPIALTTHQQDCHEDNATLHLEVVGRETNGSCLGPLDTSRPPSTSSWYSGPLWSGEQVESQASSLAQAESRPFAHRDQSTCKNQLSARRLVRRRQRSRCIPKIFMYGSLCNSSHKLVLPSPSKISTAKERATIVMPRSFLYSSLLNSAQVRERMRIHLPGSQQAGLRNGT